MSDVNDLINYINNESSESLIEKWNESSEDVNDIISPFIQSFLKEKQNLN